MPVFSVITADIIDSRLHPGFNLELKTKLDKFRPEAMLTPFSLSQGDEVQGVCRDLETLPYVIRLLRDCCRPLKIRIGVGIGQIDPWEPETTENSWNMNGEAFFRAREAVQLLHEEKFPGTKFKSGDRYFDLSINTSYLLLDLVVSKWTEEQWKAIVAYEKYQTYQKAAQVLHIARQNVQKRCQAASWDVIKTVENNLTQLIQDHFLDRLANN